MFIELKDLEINPVDFREEISPGVIDLGPEVRQRSLLRSEGRADLVEEHHGKHKVVQDIRLKGKLETSLEVACARCLDPVVHEVERSFDLLYRPLGTDSGHEELSVTDAAIEDDLPRRLQRFVSALRQEPERKSVLVRGRGRGPAVVGAERHTG